ncbi:Uncharacterised protein [Halioglobus japonicus]|nr:Uncharacterised protein [Halioglobus japonicus]
MRILGLVLALGAISWALYQMAGNGEEGSVITAEHQKSLDKAKQLEQAMKDASQRSMQDADNN